MSSNERINASAFVVFAVVFGLFCLWFLFSLTGPGHRAELKLAGLVPRWFVIANFFILPFAMLFAARALRIPFGLRSMLGALGLFLLIIAEVCYRRFPVESCVVLAVLLLEVYWIIPKWNARPQSGDSGER